MFFSKANARMAATIGATLVLLLAAALLTGCSSCKDFKARILELDGQVADLQAQLAARDANVKECENLTA